MFQTATATRQVNVSLWLLPRRRNVSVNTERRRVGTWTVDIDTGASRCLDRGPIERTIAPRLLAAIAKRIRKFGPFGIDGEIGNYRWERSLLPFEEPSWLVA